MTSIGLVGRIRAWTERWGDVVPLLLAEFIVWLGFGALLPVLPLYFTRAGRGPRAARGRDRRVAGGPAGRRAGLRLAGGSDRARPADGRRAHRTGVFSFLPLVFTGPLAFLLLRAGAGLATAAYDPAARGYLTDATPPDRRGEAFGLYGAVQMGGLLHRPGDRRRWAPTWFGGISFVFVFGGVAAWLAAIPIALRGRETGRADAPGPVGGRDRVPARRALDRPPRGHRLRRRPRRRRRGPPRRPTRLWNRGLIAVLVINAGGYFAGGTYEVIWSLFLQHLGAGLDLIGLTFAMFGLPVLLLSPFAGRLVDRRGALAFIVIGSVLPAMTGLAYTRIADPLLAVPLILIEATGFAMLNPALYAVVAANSPIGRSSTAQGIFGAAGTVGFIVASLIAGVLASANIVYPMYVFSAVLLASLVIGLLIGGRRRLSGRSAMPAAGSAARSAAPAQDV